MRITHRAGVSYDVHGEISLVGWGGESAEPLPLPAGGPYRVRYCARGMDAARDLDTRLDDDPAPDAYLLQLWPAPPAPDAVLRVTAAAAAYRHDHARTLPAARSAYVAAGLAEVDWIAPALARWTGATRCRRPSTTRTPCGAGCSVTRASRRP